MSPIASKGKKLNLTSFSAHLVSQRNPQQLFSLPEQRTVKAQDTVLLLTRNYVSVARHLSESLPLAICMAEISLIDKRRYA